MKKNRIQLKVGLSKDFLTVSLLENGNILGQDKLPNNNNLSLEALPFLEEFFKRHNASLQEIGKIEFESELSDSFTSRRIIETILNIFNWNSKSKNRLKKYKFIAR